MLDHSAYDRSIAGRSAPPLGVHETVAAWLLPATPPAHLKVTGSAPALGFERCEDPGCVVARDGTASSCGRLACPACGCGGTNLASASPLHEETGVAVRCSCGHGFVREAFALGRGLAVAAR